MKQIDPMERLIAIAEELEYSNPIEAAKIYTSMLPYSHLKRSEQKTIESADEFRVAFNIHGVTAEQPAPVNHGFKRREPVCIEHQIMTGDY